MKIWKLLLTVFVLVFAFVAIWIHAFYPPDSSCDERLDALRALRICLNDQSCLITLSDVERLERLERHCPTLPNS